MQVELQNLLDPEPARHALVDERRVHEAIGDHNRSATERRLDHVLDQLRARGRKDAGLGPGRDLAAVQNDLAQLLAEIRAARLTRGDEFPLLRLQIGLEQLDLGRLAATVKTFEGEKHPG